MLDTEHGGVNESLLDAYQLSGDRKYLNAAKRFTHQTMLNGMQSLNTSFLDNRHANTQVPKYVGMARIGEQDASATAYTTAAKNFWQDVVTNRTVCIGGNSMYEHFIAAGSSAVYIDNVDGPESCNTNNMLKLTEMLSDETHDAQYADFYEYAMWNHILSTQDPTTGGYVYFTTLRPQGYRIYSTVNESMWCCVGTGMENHSKYGHFVYTRDGKSKVYVNLFTASQLVSDDFVLTQATQFPYEPQTHITVGKAGTYTIAVRHPWWTTADFSIAVNGEVQTPSVTKGRHRMPNSAALGAKATSSPSACRWNCATPSVPTTTTTFRSSTAPSCWLPRPRPVRRPSLSRQDSPTKPCRTSTATRAAWTTHPAAAD